MSVEKLHHLIPGARMVAAAWAIGNSEKVLTSLKPPDRALSASAFNRAGGSLTAMPWTMVQISGTGATAFSAVVSFFCIR